ncbi:hypothetical protein Shyd_71710 [Streptomyces hydrogenans]|uniref:Uncharacterized protein n=1 Tax=Streptomyces hydrogenans TaxID=1873719 RepID=A0ABQ3PL96_9ACTN|nr:hypothetical protein [Streptomyces hydrogenans]GHI25800.1 hypothetical protein Shyd_71710 [Streptomyces hydrogenans]
MLEHLLARQEQYIREQVEAHDTDDFIDRLAARIGQESRRPARVAPGGPQPRPSRLRRQPNREPPGPRQHGSRRSRLGLPGAAASGRTRVRDRTAPRLDPAGQTAPAPPTPGAARRLRPGGIQGRGPGLRPAPLRRRAAFARCRRARRLSTTYSEIGARTFACLLYQLDCLDAALYWWRFAAGAGDPLSAHLLAAYHAAAGRGPDARAWRASARLLGFNDTHLPHPTRHGTTAAEGYVEHLPWNKILRSFMGSHHLPEGLGR